MVAVVGSKGHGHGVMVVLVFVVVRELRFHAMMWMRALMMLLFTGGVRSSQSTSCKRLLTSCVIDRFVDTVVCMDININININLICFFTGHAFVMRCVLCKPASDLNRFYKNQSKV